MQEMHPFSRVIPSFPAKSELVFDLGASYMFFQGEKNDKITPPVFTVKASYGWGLRRYEEETLVDLHVFGGASASSAGSLQELKDLNKNMEKLTSAIKDGQKR